MQYIWGTLTDRSLKIISILIVTAVLLFMAAPPVYAANDLLDNRYVKLSSSAASGLSTYTVGFTLSNLSTPVGSISLLFCQNSPIIGDPCVAPSSFNAATATLGAQSGQTGFLISNMSTANQLILTRPASLPSALPAEYGLANITNPVIQGSYYIRVQTFTSTDATGLDIESGGLVFVVNGGVTVSAEVPPYIRFCTSVTISGFDCSTANSFLIDFGEFSKNQSKQASSEFIVATNASFGYSVSISGTTLVSGNNVIPAVTGVASVPGTSQFGLNLRANTSPAIGANPQGPGIGSVAAAYATPNLFRFQNGDTLVTSTNSSDNQKFTVSYLANISPSQAPGYYATTLTYICLANF